MSHADEFVRAVHADLAPLYPAMPRCLDLADEPGGDFGIAHFLGIDARGCARLTFDVDKPASRYVAIHELTHGLHQYAGGSPFWMRDDDPALVALWRVLGSPLSLAAAIAIAIDIERRYGFAAAWPYYLGEIFADGLAWALTGEGPMTFGGLQRYGVTLTPDRAPALIALYRSIPARATDRPVEVEDMDRETFDRWWLENMRREVTPTVVAIKDAFNDHEHAARTGGPLVALGNEPE